MVYLGISLIISYHIKKYNALKQTPLPADNYKLVSVEKLINRNNDTYLGHKPTFNQRVPPCSSICRVHRSVCCFASRVALRRHGFGPGTAAGTGGTGGAGAGPWRRRVPSSGGRGGRCHATASKKWWWLMVMNSGDDGLRMV